MDGYKINNQSVTILNMLTRVRSAPASINNDAASACADSIAKCNGVFPTCEVVIPIQENKREQGVPIRSAVFSLVFGDPSGGCSRRLIKPVLLVVAAR